MAAKLYRYQFTVTPAPRDFNCRGTRPLSSVSFISGRNKADAMKLFMETAFLQLRKNGIVRGKKQLAEVLKVERV